MTGHFDEGLLRAYLDRQLPVTERTQVTTHVAACARCQATLAELSMLHARVDALMPAGPQTLDAHAALARVKPVVSAIETKSTRVTSSPSASVTPLVKQRRTSMQTFADSWARTRRLAYTGLAAALVLSMVAFPSVRAAADQFLQTFRAQQVVFVPVASDRVGQLQALGDLDPSRFFVSRPEITGGLNQPQTVASVAEAAKLAGFAPEQPSALPGNVTDQEITVIDTTNVKFQVDVNGLRQVLAALSVTDVLLPDALGASPITAQIPPAVGQKYTGSDYEMVLLQGHSPTVNLPGGVDIAQLGKAALEVYGMTPEQADTLSKQISWTSTLVVPFPTGMSSVQQVQVGTAQGMLVESTGQLPQVAGRTLPAGYSVLYWQQGDHFYALEGEGSAAQADVMLKVARSVR
jgi:anti-sigma factor RsiW